MVSGVARPAFALARRVDPESSRGRRANLAAKPPRRCRSRQLIPGQIRGKFSLWILLDVQYIVAGSVTFENPLLAAALLTLVLGAMLVASGITGIILAFNMKAGARGSGSFSTV